MKLKKGSAEAKRFMAKIRAMKSGAKKKTTKKAPKKIGATKFVEQNETKSTKPKRNIQITRRSDGTFKKFKQISGLHKDTKSHNVQISVVSGLKNDVLNTLDDTFKKIDLYTDMKNTYGKMSKNKTIQLEDRKHYKYMYNVANKHIISLKKEIILLKKLI